MIDSSLPLAPSDGGSPSRHRTYVLSHLDALEAEAIHILREVRAQFERPVLLFSGGKDSLVVSHLAKKAFLPGPYAFSLMHVDTGHNFPETLAFRDAWVAQLKATLIVASVEEGIERGLVAEEPGPNPSRNAIQTPVLLDAISTHKIDCAVGGARRDEEKARAKERFFSHRDSFGQWNPKNQRPELWRTYNGRQRVGEHFRVFPLSNWTELDIWQYIQREALEVPSLYFSHMRNVVTRDDVLLAETPFITIMPGETVENKQVRFRTIGDATCTGAIPSTAATIDEVIAEVMTARTTERGVRTDDRRSETAMEDRKRDGYF